MLWYYSILTKEKKSQRLLIIDECAITGALGLSTFSDVSIIRIYYF